MYIVIFMFSVSAWVFPGVCFLCGGYGGGGGLFGVPYPPANPAGEVQQAKGA